ncbi:MAG: polysaccharide lyase [Bacteroidota bacterium]
MKQEAPVMMSSSSLLTSSNLLYEEIFEGLGPYFYPGNLQTGTSYGFTVAGSPVYQGLKAGRFELRDTDPATSGGTRAEAKYPRLTHPNRWYSFAVFIPSIDYKYDSKAEIINQWHQGGGVNPPISLITRYDKLYLEIRPVPEIKNQFLLGNLVKDKWQSFVLHIYHSSGTNGLVEIWRDGVKIFTKQGVNAYSFSTYEKPQWKLGLYKWDWNGTETTETKKRVIYFDNVRIGNELATYSDMVQPANALLSPLPSIKSFTLVNAGTEKDIMIISNGSTISLSQLGVSKLNIRANPGAGVGSVKFIITGAETRSSKDSKIPYAMNGDDGYGNYYFGSWSPPPLGTYTLSAIPYSASNATGLLGIARNIQITFIK